MWCGVLACPCSRSRNHLPTCWVSIATRAQVEAAAWQRVRGRGRPEPWPLCARQWRGHVPGARVMWLPPQNLTFPLTYLHLQNMLEPKTSYVLAVGCRLGRFPETVDQLRFSTGAA